MKRFNWGIAMREREEKREREEGLRLKVWKEEVNGRKGRKVKN